MSDVYVSARGGMTFHLIDDDASDAAPKSFRDSVEAAAKLLSLSMLNPITVNIKVTYSGAGGGATGKPDNGAYESYEPISAAEVGGIVGAVAGAAIEPLVSTIIGGAIGTVAGGALDLVGLTDSILPSSFRQDIRQDLIQSSGSQLASVLPQTQTINGSPFVWVSNAELKAFGLMKAQDATSDDGSVNFNTGVNPQQLLGVALHELTHALGRTPLPAVDPITGVHTYVLTTAQQKALGLLDGGAPGGGGRHGHVLK